MTIAKKTAHAMQDVYKIADAHKENSTELIGDTLAKLIGEGNSYETLITLAGTAAALAARLAPCPTCGAKSDE